MLHFDGDSLTRLTNRCTVYLGEGGCAYGLFLKFREEVGELKARVSSAHVLYGFEGGYGTFVLQWYEGIAPFVRQQVVHAAQMLSQLDEDGAVLLECV